MRTETEPDSAREKTKAEKIMQAS